MLDVNFWQDKINSKKVIKEKKLFEAGKMRCGMRKEMEQRNQALHVGLPT